ncbi:MAG: VOC family protein [Gemmatimonadales bacterium]|nr:VOC family protein [Gemmatimonadales bacterium]
MAGNAMQGRILWYELMTTDMKAAEKFYKTVVGWSTVPFDGSPDPYSMWMRDGGVPVGGLMAIPTGMSFPPHWGMYVGVSNLEQATAAIEKAGGKVLSEIIDVPKIGRMRAMMDPQGAAFSIYQPENPPGPEAQADLGEVSWNELMTTDAAGALGFYGKIFGWKERNSVDMGPMGTYHIWGRDWDLGGAMNKSKEMEMVPNHWGFYFRVPDVKKSVDVVKANGGQVINGPMEVPGGTWIVNCADPQGAHFSMHNL